MGYDMPKNVSSDGMCDSSGGSVQKIKNPGGKQNALSMVGSNSTAVQDGGTATLISTVNQGALSGGQPVAGPNSPSPDQSLISTL